MGVPRLFPWIITTFRHAIKQFIQGDKIYNVDNLYLDANGLLHGAAKKVFGDDLKKLPRTEIEKPSYKEKRLRVYELFFDNVIDVTKTMIPKKLLYIAIDGPAPLAKQAQQRQRRFESAMKLTADSEFDRSSITPGTLFMFELTKYIHTAIRREMNKYGSPWRDIDVIFSPPTVEGEGEHKILNYIRTLPEHIKNTETHCLFGPDADLIMLTLAIHLPKIYLLREETPREDDTRFPIKYLFYYLLNMGDIRVELVKVLGQLKGYNTKQRTLNDISNDFVMEGLFVGNDFVPKIQMFLVLENGLELMLNTYAKTSQGGITNHLTRKSSQGNIYTVDYHGLLEFVGALQKNEIRYLTDQAKVPIADEKFRNQTLLRNITEKVSSHGNVEYSLNFENYRKDYYKKSKIDINDKEKIKLMCMDYLKSLFWVFGYYVNGLPSWTHYYSWYYAPLMVDLYSVMKSLTKDEISSLYVFDYGQPSLPFVQLLSVLSPRSSNLLPTKFGKLMTDENSPLVKAGYYPEKIEVDCEGKVTPMGKPIEHMCVSLLPFVDVEKIRKAYEEVAKTVNIKYTRNTLGKNELFKYDKKYSVRYTSRYGNIQLCHVKKRFIV